MPTSPLRFRQAIVRTPSADFARGITTVSGEGPPEHERMLAQHADYVTALEHAGLEVVILPPLDAFPDAHFVEDVAVVLPEVAVIARPGALSRRGEEEHMIAALEPLRPIRRVEAPAVLDGGDVLVTGETILVGLSSRTDERGAAALAAIAEPFGYRVETLPVPAGLHFKSSVNIIAPGVLVATESWAGRAELAAFEIVVVPAGEAYAANVLRVNDHLLVPEGYARTNDLLRDRGFHVVDMAMSECRKMDGGLTCLSLRL